MGHIRLQVEPSQVRNIEEWHLLDVHLELARLSEFSERSLRQPFIFMNLDFPLVALLLEVKLLAECHGVRVFEFLIFSKLV